MSLLAILISLIAERFLGSMEELRRFDWFAAYRRLFADRLIRPGTLLDGPLGLLLMLLPLLAAVALLDYYLARLWILFTLGFSVLMLLYCFGPRDLEAEVEAFVDARVRGDEESAAWHAAELLGTELPQEPAELTRRLIANIFVEANERLLAVIFWFVLLGPVGALLYRLACLLREEGGEGLAEAGTRLHHILAWLPTRLTAIAYALAGSFVESWQAWRSEDSRWPERSRRLLLGIGFGALRYEPAEDDADRQGEVVAEAMSLVRRAVLVFLSVIAIFTMAGWMG